MAIKGAKIMTLQEAENLRYRYPLPKSLMRAAGLMKHKKKALEQHLKKIRSEWDK